MSIGLRMLGAALAVVAALTISSAARAVPITGGQTQVTLTAASTLAGLGLTVSPYGTATIQTGGSAPVATFPITGGSANGTALLIQHVGSGLNLTGGSTTLSLRNFLIDTTNAVIDGDAFLNNALVGNVPLFTIGSGLTLSLTSQAAGAIQTAFTGAPNLAGAVIGTATTSPILGTAVPEPAAAALMGAGILALGLARRRTGPHAA